MHAERRQVVRCWHPMPPGDLVEAKNGSMIETNVGEPAYQTTDGTVVAL